MALDDVRHAAFSCKDLKAAAYACAFWETFSAATLSGCPAFAAARHLLQVLGCAVIASIASMAATCAAGSKFGGAWTAKDHTTLLLVFDNAYSLVTAKDVAVAVSVRSATYRPAEESLSAMAEYRKEWRELHTDSKV